MDESARREDAGGSPSPQGSGGGRRRRRGRRRFRPRRSDPENLDDEEDGLDRIIDPREAGARIVSELNFGPEDINEDARKVVRRLARYGFQAYLVGGCVRDLLCGLRPKDFDVATSATPRQVKKLFRNSRIIGRRFRLVHVHFGGHVVEVSTFRRQAEQEEGADDLLIRRDNVFGRADEDALRRDFTCNALFYDLERDEVIDFVGGMEDIERETIEVIGDPVRRLKEDPVRMLRAVKFAGRLGFDLADDLRDAIHEVRHDLERAAAPRLFEELQRLVNRGHALASFRELRSTGLLQVFLPEIDEFLDGAPEPAEEGEMSAHQRFWNTLRTLDQFVLEDRDVTQLTMLTCLFCHLFERVLLHQGPLPEGVSPVEYDIGIATEEAMKPVAQRLQMPRRDLYRIKQLVIALRRFLSKKSHRKRPSPNQLVRKDYFPESLRLFEIYSRASGAWQGEVVRWRKRYESALGLPVQMDDDEPMM